MTNQEMVKSLVEGFANTINKTAKTFATKEDLTELRKEFKEEIKELKNEINDALNKQTDRVIKVLEKYEQKTEKHESLYNRISEEFKPKQKQ